MDPALLHEAAALADQGVGCALAVVVETHGSVPGKAGATMLVTADGTTRGTVGGAGLEERVRVLARDAVRTGRSSVHEFDLARWKSGGLDSVCGGTVRVAIHVVRPTPRLLLVGAGHCSLALDDVAHGLGWNVTVVDSRPEYARAERFRTAKDVVCAVPAVHLRELDDLDAYSHAYLLGHSHHEDGDALIALLERGFPGIVGVIGSRSKMHAFRERAVAAGIPASALERVRCPIGLDLGAQTPAEIAVAVAAEILQDAKRGLPHHAATSTDAPLTPFLSSEHSP